MKSMCVMLVVMGASVVGCGDDQKSTSVPDKKFSGSLAVDIKGSANVELIEHPDETIDVTLNVQGREATGLIDFATTYSAKGTIEVFPEANTILYVAKFSAPAMTNGPCASEPISWALSLERRGKNARVGGSLTAYCGKETFYGVPARVLRLTGELP